MSALEVSFEIKNNNLYITNTAKEDITKTSREGNFKGCMNDMLNKFIKFNELKYNFTDDYTMQIPLNDNESIKKAIGFIDYLKDKVVFSQYNDTVDLIRNELKLMQTVNTAGFKKTPPPRKLSVEIPAVTINDDKPVKTKW